MCAKWERQEQCTSSRPCVLRDSRRQRLGRWLVRETPSVGSQTLLRSAPPTSCWLCAGAAAHVLQVAQIRAHARKLSRSGPSHLCAGRSMCGAPRTECTTSFAARASSVAGRCQTAWATTLKLLAVAAADASGAGGSIDVSSDPTAALHRLVLETGLTMPSGLTGGSAGCPTERNHWTTHGPASPHIGLRSDHLGLPRASRRPPARTAPPASNVAPPPDALKTCPRVCAVPLVSQSWSFASFAACGSPFRSTKSRPLGPGAWATLGIGGCDAKSRSRVKDIRKGGRRHQLVCIVCPLFMSGFHAQVADVWADDSMPTAFDPPSEDISGRLSTFSQVICLQRCCA